MTERVEVLEQEMYEHLDSVANVKVRAFGEIESTMDAAREWAKEELLVEGELRLVFARTQTQGRGRRGRSWNSEAEGVYCTVFTSVAVAPAQLAGLSLVVGIATMRMLEVLVPGSCGLKWPNDVLTKAGKKLSGTLIETQSMSKGNQAVFIGVGINCRGNVSDELEACTLEELRSSETEPTKVCALLTKEFNIVLPRFFRNGFGAFRDEWLSRALYVNAEVSVVDEDRRISGVVSGIRSDGALELRTRDGNRAITVGDVAAI